MKHLISSPYNMGFIEKGNCSDAKKKISKISKSRLFVSRKQNAI